MKLPPAALSQAAGLMAGLVAVLLAGCTMPQPQPTVAAAPVDPHVAALCKLYALSQPGSDIQTHSIVGALILNSAINGTRQQQIYDACVTAYGQCLAGCAAPQQHADVPRQGHIAVSPSPAPVMAPVGIPYTPLPQISVGSGAWSMAGPGGAASGAGGAWAGAGPGWAGSGSGLR